jgi:hypothetical protein
VLAPVWSIEGFDGLCIQIFDCLFVTPAHSILRPRISIKRINRFRYPHLRGRHSWDGSTGFHHRQFMNFYLAMNPDTPSLPSVAYSPQSPWSDISYEPVSPMSPTNLPIGLGIRTSPQLRSLDRSSSPHALSHSAISILTALLDSTSGRRGDQTHPSSS